MCHYYTASYAYDEVRNAFMKSEVSQAFIFKPLLAPGF